MEFRTDGHPSGRFISTKDLRILFIKTAGLLVTRQGPLPPASSLSHLCKFTRLISQRHVAHSVLPHRCLQNEKRYISITENETHSLIPTPTPLFLLLYKTQTASLAQPFKEPRCIMEMCSVILVLAAASFELHMSAPHCQPCRCRFFVCFCVLLLKRYM